MKKTGIMGEIEEYGGALPNAKYVESSIYCPWCGKKGLLLIEGDDDYIGSIGWCTSCKREHWGFDYHGELEEESE